MNDDASPHRSGRCRNGTIVHRLDLSRVSGLVSGEVTVGENPRGEKVFRRVHWYPDGRLSPGRESDWDLMEVFPVVPIAHTIADQIAARTRVDMIEQDAETALDQWLDQGEMF